MKKVYQLKYSLLCTFLTSLISAEAFADNAFDNFSQSTSHSVKASGHSLKATGQAVSAVAAVPLVVAGEVGKVSGQIGNDLWDAANGKKPDPLIVDEKLISAGPSPAEALDGE